MAGKSRKRKAEAVAEPAETAPKASVQAIADASEPERKKRKKKKKLKDKKDKRVKLPRDRSPSPKPSSPLSDKTKRKAKKSKASKKDKREKMAKASATTKPADSNFSPVPVPDPTDDPFTTKRSWVDWSKADFGQNTARKDKFLRLLGAKKSKPTQDSTPASSNGTAQSDTATSMLDRGHVCQVERNLEQQFSKGIQQRKQAMRGRKAGLGFGG